MPHTLEKVDVDSLKELLKTLATKTLFNDEPEEEAFLEMIDKLDKEKP